MYLSRYINPQFTMKMMLKGWHVPGDAPVVGAEGVTPDRGKLARAVKHQPFQGPEDNCKISL